ncbi:MAG: hypothetical protein J6580_07580 [Gilliamella sp.]|uniref:CPCC family cysteine-rich protein n=1 Tax=Gilliamella sp. TaxID=1891236 RepID=UPI0025E57F10|nr:CPCC family cysteine-rich protein [Gilliamella sp.]MCO6550528.1 hypothetical protein [Gilliamella sp.]
MKTLSRKLALTLLAIEMITQSTKQDIENILFANYLDKEGQPLAYNNIYDDAIEQFLLGYFVGIKLKGYSNQYLKQYISALYREPITIIGDEDILHACPCCHYLTLTHQGQYDVCPLCYWEDDGTQNNELNHYSAVNHLTLSKYKAIFDKQKATLTNIPYKLANRHL